MKRILGVTLVAAWMSVAPFQAQQAQPAQAQSFTATISDSMCGLSHQQMMGTKKASSERSCIFECIKGLAKYVLIDQNKKIIPILNQDAAGLPLYAGKLVLVTGQMQGDAIALSKVEPPPAHTHIGHVMTSWRDTPATIGLLPAAIADGKVAATHAKLAAAATDLDQMKLHAGHVLNALDPTQEAKGPGSGYGVKKGAAGALQHSDFAAKAAGASAGVKTHATHVAASLTDVIQWTDQAIATAQKVRAATTVAEAAPLVKELATLTTQITDGTDANNDGQIGWQAGEGGLAQAQMHMELMVKGEGL